MSYSDLPIIKETIVSCYKCGRWVILDASIKSYTGKRVPLEAQSKVPHECLGALA